MTRKRNVIYVNNMLACIYKESNVVNIDTIFY